MQWNSAAEFFAMGEHGLYVWGSVGVCALCMLVEWRGAVRSHAQARRELKAQLAAELIEGRRFHSDHENSS